MKGKNDLVMIGGIALLIALATGWISFDGSQTQSAFDGGVGEVSQTSGGVGYATTLSVGGVNAITGATVDVNGDAFASDFSWSSGEVQVNSQPEQLSTSAPNTMRGELFLGNDENQGTDRGTEVYRRKITFDYSGKGAEQIRDPSGGLYVKLYAEGTPTWTGYDDGTAESTLNITVGSGQTVTSTELKFAAGSDVALGNPEFSRPLGVCFNVSSTAKFDKIRPVSYEGTFDAPEVLSGKNILGDCYILKTGTIKDYEEFRFYIVIDAATGQNPINTDYAYVFLMDKTYYKNDASLFEAGWGDDSDEGTDYDPGLDGSANAKQIWFN